LGKLDGYDTDTSSVISYGGEKYQALVHHLLEGGFKDAQPGWIKAT
jgi:hypothetical protein